MQTKRLIPWGGLLAFLLALGVSEEGFAFEAVGLVSPTGGACFVKRFEVAPGTLVEGVEFASNDDRIVFQKVALLRGPAERLADAAVLWEGRNARGSSAHRVSLAFPGIRIDSARELLVAVYLPPTDGVRGVSDGAGLGATRVAEPNGCFIASSADAPLQALGFDLAIWLRTGTAGKGSSDVGAAGAAPLVAQSPAPGISDLRFDVPHAGPVSLVIYDVAGREVRRLVDEQLAPGLYVRPWDGRDSRGLAVVSGVYVVKLHVPGPQEVTQKLVLLR